MSAVLIFIILAVAILLIGLVVGLVALVNGRKQPPRRDLPASAPTGTITEERPPEAPEAPEAQAPVITLERPEGTAGRLVRLRQRLSRSQGGLGRGLLLLLSRDRLDEDTWEEIEDTLITADVGVAATQELVERLRTRMRVEGV
ncbi:MAG: signal recognition particle-docking protein FtsY, partial [Marmoricola sp.]|nr:signal recognition particle-docking protein FtsY [Marmoricola sp.]